MRSVASQLLARGDVAVHGVDEVDVPVEVDRAGDVGALVDPGIDADLEDSHGRIVEVVPDPVGGHEGIGWSVICLPFEM